MKKYVKTFESFISDDNLYHYTTLKSLKLILIDGYIQGYAGSIYDEEDGDTISTTSDCDYHSKGHDISCDCRLTLNAKEIKKNYEVHQDEDYGYIEMKVEELMEDGISREDAEKLANENQEIIMASQLPISYITHIQFYKKPSSMLVNLIKSKNINYSI